MSDARFADGLRYRIEIPSVEGPAVLRAVLEEADARGVPLRRVSQGSGVMMLTDTEIAEMAALGRAAPGMRAVSPSPRAPSVASRADKRASTGRSWRPGAPSRSAFARCSWRT